MRFAVALLGALITHAAQAQVISLACEGMVHQFAPERTSAKTYGAAIVDIDRKVLTTPMGKFEIYQAGDTNISFGDHASLIVTGSLDRMTGRMNIYWRTVAENQKMIAGQKAQMMMQVEMTCVPNKPLF
jgi:hypothetical protein